VIPTTKFYDRSSTGKRWTPGSPWVFGHPAILGAIMVCANGDFIAWNGIGKDTIHRTADEAAQAVRQFHLERKNSASRAP
jgi:hypothetical protein